MLDTVHRPSINMLFKQENYASIFHFLFSVSLRKNDCITAINPIGLKPITRPKQQTHQHVLNNALDQFFLQYQRREKKRKIEIKLKKEKRERERERERERQIKRNRKKNRTCTESTMKCEPNTAVSLKFTIPES